jgi:hypothetical protein
MIKRENILRMSDSDIMGWNNSDRLPQGIWATARYTNTEDIQMDFKGGWNMDKSMGNPYIEYMMAFSVLKDKEEDFQDILDNLSSRPFQNSVINRQGTNEKVSAEKKIASFKRTEHLVGKTEFARFEYTLEGSASSVLAWRHVLEKSVEIFSLIWGHTDDGEVRSILKFPVGSIVSLKSNRSHEMLVMDLNYRTIPTPSISYIACEILNQKGSVIRYGEAKEYGENDLTWSRSGRIDDILEE